MWKVRQTGRELVQLERKEDAEQWLRPDLFGRHDPCKARLAPAKTQVKPAFDGPSGQGSGKEFCEFLER